MVAGTMTDCQVPAGRTCEWVEFNNRAHAHAIAEHIKAKCCDPKGPKYPNMEYICHQESNYGSGYILHVWVPGPLGCAIS